MKRAFEEANGLWYVATEDDNGFHRQGTGTMTQSQAERAAKGDTSPLWIVRTIAFPPGGPDVPDKTYGPYSSFEAAKRCKARIERRIPGTTPRNGYIERA